MFSTLIRVDDVDGLVAAFEAILNERQQQAIFLLIAIEQSTDVTYLIEAEPAREMGFACCRMWLPLVSTSPRILSRRAFAPRNEKQSQPLCHVTAHCPLDFGIGVYPQRTDTFVQFSFWRD